MKLKNWGWEAKLGDGIISWLIFFFPLVLINDLWDCLFDFLAF
jgi:hypothetical protein